MKISNMPTIFFVFAMAVMYQLSGTEAQAISTYFTSQGCSGCHSAPVVATCNGCHAHGTHPSSAKSSINVAGVTNKTSYSPGETVTVTLTGGYRTGWVRAVIYDQNTIELARSNGNASGMGGSATYPTTLSAPAPTAPGTYTWKAAWYGNQYDAGGAAFGPGWTPDPTNPGHGSEIVSINSFTVAAPADTTAPVVSAFTLPTTATSLTVSVSSFTATDNVAVTGYLVTTSATAPAVTATGWTVGAPSSVTASAAGSTTFYAWAKDAAGNVSSAMSASVTITLPDTTAPVVSAFTLPATATSLTVPVSSFIATDNVAVTGYLVTTSATAPAATATGWTTSAPSSVTASAAGSTTFYAWAKDAAGNVSSAKSATVSITLPDATAPVVNAFTLPATATSLTVPVSSFTATDNVAVTGYLVTTSATAPAAGGTGWTTSAPSSVTASAAGNTTFYAWTKDAAGNVSSAKSASVVITLPDTIAPVVSAFTMPATSSSLTVPVSSFTATDNVAVTGYLVTTSAVAPAAGATGWTTTAPASATAPAAGSVTFYAWAKDASGNVSATISDTVTITVITANVSLTVSTVADGSITNNPTLNVNGTATDPVGIKSVTVNGQAVTVNAVGGTFSTAVTLQIGVNQITVIAIDNSGLQKSDTRMVTYDPAAPIITVSSPADNSSTTQSFTTVTGSINESSTVAVSVNGGSPQSATITGNTYSATVNLVSGINTISITATDLAGNSASVNRTITYSVAANTNLGLAVTYPSQDIVTSTPYIYLKGKVVDSQEHVSVTIKMNDKTYAPEIDDGRFQQRLSFTRAKQYTITVTAKDGAGNTSVVIRNVIYRPLNLGNTSHDDDHHDDD